MPGMELGLKLALTRKSATATIFPVVQRHLEDSEWRDAIRWVASREELDRFRDLIDFWFCALHPEFRQGCFDYYSGEERELKYTLSETARLMAESGMVVALGVAVHWMRNNRQPDCWDEFLAEVDRVIARLFS